MTRSVPQPLSIGRTIDDLEFYGNRTPTTTDDEMPGAFAVLAEYRDGGIFVGHWAGASEWERHPVGDEIVMVVDGATTMFLMVDDAEHAVDLGPGEMLVVPQGTWHRFETPERVEVLTVTPQPTEHTADAPSA
jgi:mannose-6-phosphate isomerase-like protein (cupin superfamily)